MCILRYSILLCFLCVNVYAQQKTPSSYPKKPTENRPERLEESLQHLGQVLGRTCETVVTKLEDEQTWQKLTLQLAELGNDLRRLGETPQSCMPARSVPPDSVCGEVVRWGNYEKVKKFSKSFRLTANQQFAVENKFGKVHINTWDKPDATVDVVIKARAESESKAQTMLDRISIAVEEGSDEVLVRTQFSEASNWMGGKQSFEINYVVNMPRTHPLRVKNSFGDTYVAELQGKAELSTSYGNLKADRLLHTDNYVKVAFGSGGIGYCKAGTVKVSYSEMEITDGGSLNVESSYSELSVKNIQWLHLVAKYGDIFVSSYGKGFKGMDIDGSFSSIDLRIPTHQSFDFEVKTSYADFDVDESRIPFSAMQVQKSGNSRTYIGTFGKSATSSIKVTSRYGDVDLGFRD